MFLFQACHHRHFRIENLGYQVRGRRFTHYDVLGVSHTASRSQIKSHFYKLSKQHHPDVSNNPESAKLFRKASEAYAILSNDRERRAYDRSILHRAPPPTNHVYHHRAPPTRSPRASHAWEPRHKRKPPSPDYPYPNSQRQTSGPHEPYRHALHHDVLVGARRKTEEQDRRVDKIRREGSFLKAVQVTGLLLLAATAFSSLAR